MDGLHKHTITVTVAPTGDGQQPRTLSIVMYVDPRRENDLRSIHQHPELAPIDLAQVPPSKYQFKKLPLLEAKTGAKRRYARRRSQRAPTAAKQHSMTPSLSPVASSSNQSSLSPVTPFHSLPPSDPITPNWPSQSCSHMLYFSPLSQGHDLAPIRQPMVDATSARRTVLPPLRLVVGDMLKPGYCETYGIREWPLC